MQRAKILMNEDKECTVKEMATENMPLDKH